jgi:hypothetical protein
MDDARRVALDLLASPGADTRFGPSSLADQIVQRSGCRPHQAYEALWGLVAEGLAYIDPGRQWGPENWSWRLSEDGLQAAGGGSWEPRDREGFLRRLRHHDPPIETAAITYLDEALRAFNARCYLSTTVMLGVAVECVFVSAARAVVAVETGRGHALAKRAF